MFSEGSIWNIFNNKNSFISLLQKSIKFYKIQMLNLFQGLDFALKLSAWMLVICTLQPLPKMIKTTKLEPTVLGGN